MSHTHTHTRYCTRRHMNMIGVYYVIFNMIGYYYVIFNMIGCLLRHLQYDWLLHRIFYKNTYIFAEHQIFLTSVPILGDDDQPIIVKIT